MLHFHPASRHDGWVHGKPIVVTGGAGFIGSHLTDRLLEAGEQVIVVDDLSAGSRSNLSLAERNPLFSFRACKVSECHDLESLVASAAMVGAVPDESASNHRLARRISPMRRGSGSGGVSVSLITSRICFPQRRR